MKPGRQTCVFLILALAAPVWAQSDSSAAPVERTRLEAKAMAGLLVNRVSPVYPPLARQARIQGTVVLHVIVGADGSITDLTLVSGHPMLAPAAIAAVRQWKYQPYMLNGKAAEVETQVVVNFTLQGSPASAQSSGAWPMEVDDQDSSPGERKDSDEALVIRWAMPDFSQQPAAQRISGRVLLKVFISETGTADNVEVVGGDPNLAQVAVASAKQWQFAPFIRDGKAIPATTTISFSFGAPAAPPDSEASTQLAQESLARVVPLRVRVSSGVMAGLLTGRVQPAYPPEASAQGIQGTVVLRLLVNREGIVTALERISGPVELTPAAEAAVRQWRYRPFILMGEPVNVQTKVQVNFRLR
jgi:TonB family protein